MTPSQNEGRSLQQWLSHQPAAVNDLLSRAQRLAQMNQALRQWTGEEWLAQIRVANVRSGTLVLYSSSAAALVPLRYRTQELLDWLNQRFGLACTRLEVKVRPLPPDATRGV
jgi:hypothetical protein